MKKKAKRALRCTNCGAKWHGEYATGFWQPDEHGEWAHWCHGGRPGTWQIAKWMGLEEEQ